MGAGPNGPDAPTAATVPRISELARDLGFSDLTAFSSAFQTTFRYSPSEPVHDRVRLQGAVEKDVFADWIAAMRLGRYQARVRRLGSACPWLRLRVA